MKKLFAFLVLILIAVGAQGSYVPYSITSGANKERIESVNLTTICTTGTCSIATQSGSWVTSIVHSSTGNYAVTFVAGVWASAPVCMVSASANDAVGSIVFGITTSGATVTLYNPFSAVVTPKDSAFALTCMGLRS